MNSLTEDAIEQNLIALLKKQGYQYLRGNELKRSFDEPVLEGTFKAALKRLNPNLPESVRAAGFQHVLYLGAGDVMSNNEKFHQMMIDGVTTEYFKKGESIGLQIRLIDFDKPENNDFLVVNQFIIRENNQSKRLDLVLFVNGLPLVVIELKSAIREFRKNILPIFTEQCY
jgi:type I restriction enzyme, R subunit